MLQDLPDVEGDVKYNIDTLAGKYGVQKVANAASTVLALGYVAAIITPFLMPGHFKMLPMVIGHTSFLGYFLISLSKLNGSEISSVKKFYKSIWNLFYLEYCLYPFI